MQVDRSGGLYRVTVSEEAQAPPEAVYDTLADLSTHIEWGGSWHPSRTQRLQSMEAPEGAATVGVEFWSVGTTGAGSWHDRSTVTEATRPALFEFVTEGRREGKPGSQPWLSTAVHRYEISSESGGCRVTYTEDLTRLAGAPRILLAPGISRILFRISAKCMRRGFEGLLALAEERSAAR